MHTIPDKHGPPEASATPPSTSGKAVLAEKGTGYESPLENQLSGGGPSSGAKSV